MHLDRAGDHALWLADRRVLIVLISAVVITPLCMPRDLNALEWVSSQPVARGILCSQPTNPTLSAHQTLGSHPTKF
jgi:hypothetical protein